MDDKRPGEPPSGDSGMSASVTSVVAGATPEEPSSSPSNESQGSRTFSEISKGVWYLSDSSQTEKASASNETEEEKWASSVSPNNDQPSLDVNPRANLAMVNPDQDSDLHHLLQFGKGEEHSWKNQIPTLDSYPSAMQASTSPVDKPTSEYDSPPSFTVGPPAAVPREEENVDSSSDIVVQKPDMKITGDVKKDRDKVLHLESELRKSQANIFKLEKKLEATTKEKEETQKELKEAKENIKKIKAASAIETAAMKEKYEAKIAGLKSKLASVEKENSDLKEEYCKQIQDLHKQLNEQEQQHLKKVIELKDDKHVLELKVKEMKINEERLKRELSEANLEAARLQNALERTRNAETLRKRDDEICELKRLLSQVSMRSDS